MKKSFIFTIVFLMTGTLLSYAQRLLTPDEDTNCRVVATYNRAEITYRNPATVTANAQTIKIMLAFSPLDCRQVLSFSNLPSWIRVAENTYGYVTFSIAENQTATVREVTIAGSTGGEIRMLIPISIQQAAGSGCDGVNYYSDTDGDGFGDALSTPEFSCTPIPGRVTNNIDTCPNAYSLTNNGCPDPVENLNWVQSKSYDITGKVLSSSKAYFDELGRGIQTQTYDIKEKRIWAAQTLYDYSGRAAFTTLSAPITNKNSDEIFQYKEGFIKKPNNANYTVADFENSNIENPATVGTQPHTLGNYYSTSNADEMYQDKTDRPYSRTIYSTLNPGAVKQVIGGNKIDNQWKQAYSFSMNAAQEMYYAFGYDYFPGTPDIAEIYSGINTVLNDPSKHITWLRVHKTVVEDVHGNEFVSFTDDDGKALASARSGGTKQYEVVSLIGAQKYVDIHLPKGCEGTLSFLGNASDYKVYDLKSEQVVPANNPGAGFYRIEYTGTLALQKEATLAYIDKSNKVIYPVAATHAGVRYKVNYYDYTLNYYNDTGHLKATLQPLGFNDDSLDNLSANVAHNYNLNTTFTQNSLGQILKTTSPDEGDAEFKYRKDGQIRFSQNSKQSGVQSIIESDFAVGYGGWLQYEYGNSNPVLENGRLKVNVSASWGGIRHKLSDFSTTPGETLNITLTFDKATTQSKILLYIQELDQAGNHLSWNNISPDLNSGTHQYAYTVNQANKLSLLIVKDNTNTTAETHFYIDHIGLSRISDVVEEFSYTNYDFLGRPVESGICTGDFSYLDPDTSTTAYGVKREQQYTIYDEVTYQSSPWWLFYGLYYGFGSYVPAHYRQTYLSGNVASTYDNNGHRTWYSYDIYGRVRWIVQAISGHGLRTIDYEYDPVTGQVAKVIYQKFKSSERFIHRYTYNEVQELIRVETSTDDIEYITHASYQYYETGALKRTEIANGLQGIDYVYNLAGQLKAINHPDLNAANDPGGDNNDLFGMVIDYYNGDYTRNPNFSMMSSGTDQFNGNIKGITSNTNWGNGTNTPAQYSYQYNSNNWLTEATFSGGNAVAADDYKVHNITYDANGNIQTLYRNKNTEANSSNLMDRFTYHYKPGKPNRLDHVDDAVTTTTNANDLKDQDTNNYTYNIIGQLVNNAEEGVSYEYNASGLVTKVYHNNVIKVAFTYNDKGFRTRKTTYNNGTQSHTTDYIRDVSGNVLAIYENNTLVELPVYGASRVGIYKKQSHSTLYQLTDHLGNVRAVVSKQHGIRIAITDFNNGNASPCIASGTATADVENGRLKISTDTDLNGANGYYSLQANTHYEISIEVDKTGFADAPLEFGIWQANVLKQNRIVAQNGVLYTTFTPSQTGTYRFNFRLREDHYSGPGQIVYIDNVIINKTIQNGTLAVTHATDYYPFGLKHKGYNNVWSVLMEIHLLKSGSIITKN
ncbi:MAG: hypothetical protein GKR88_15800 [Flavobacteriaceae bacterium]|nr:MAG: hypothetical protein GKR88_15800 [Flavobacteriaceae bacterium]